MNRVILSALLVMVTLSGQGAAQPAQSESQKPNILFIAIDDLNDWIEPLRGHPQVKTPHLNRLAARGTTFTNAHCQAPLCNPSRASLLTGLRPSTTGVYALNPWFRTAPQFRDQVTLPQHFMQNGYRVLTTGKIFHDAYPPNDERADGREVTVWGLHGGFQPRPQKKFVETPDANPLVDWGVFPARDEECFDYDVTSWAVRQLQAADKSRPFFLSVGLRHPHVPLYAPQKWFDLYPEDKLVMPPVREDDRKDTPEFSWYLHWKLPEPRLSWLQRANQWRNIVRAYLASVSYADAMVGRLLDALQSSGLQERTIVVVWSDHGWHLGEKGITGKNTLWERSTHVPLIFAGPGIARAARSARPAELLDLYPTLVELCALPRRQGLDGHSLMPQLKNAQAAREFPAITTHGPDNHTVRDERWRYIRYADGSEELYDMQRDPNEWMNLAGDQKLTKVKQRLARWLPKNSAAPVPESKVRLIEIRDGKPYWEGQLINPAEIEK